MTCFFGRDKWYNPPPNKIILLDRKSTRLNSSHTVISYAVFCLKKKKIPERRVTPAKTGGVWGTASTEQNGREVCNGTVLCGRYVSARDDVQWCSVLCVRQR